MTPKQVKALAFVEATIDVRRHAPSYGEIAAHMGLKSKSGVARLLAALERMGRIRRGGRGLARSIEIVEPRVRIPNDVLPALRDYAREKRTTIEVAAAEWLRAFAGAA